MIITFTSGNTIKELDTHEPVTLAKMQELFRAKMGHKYYNDPTDQISVSPSDGFYFKLCLLTDDGSVEMMIPPNITHTFENLKKLVNSSDVNITLLCEERLTSESMEVPHSTSDETFKEELIAAYEEMLDKGVVDNLIRQFFPPQYFSESMREEIKSDLTDAMENNIDSMLERFPLYNPFYDDDYGTPNKIDDTESTNNSMRRMADELMDNLKAKEVEVEETKESDGMLNDEGGDSKSKGCENPSYWANAQMMINGIPVEPQIGKLTEIWRNVTVEVLEFPDGTTSIAWYRQDDTERIL